MKIRAGEKEFRRWFHCVPRESDLVFLNGRAKEFELPAPVFSSEEIKTKKVDLWPLNSRSWFGYALDRAKFSASLPSGAIEAFDEKTLKHLATMQIQLDVHSLIPTAKLSKSARSKIGTFSNFGWVTSHSWNLMTESEQLEVFAAWYAHNEIEYYESIELEDLPESARTELTKTGLARRLNTFADSSGPNCFATVAAAISPRADVGIAEEWLHWPRLERILHARGFSPMKARGFVPGDVLVFSEKNHVVHAAYALSSELYFEKPGQDFYEPYRIAKTANVRRDWPKATVTIYRSTATLAAKAKRTTGSR